jgi:hypothetical protein
LSADWRHVLEEWWLVKGKALPAPGIVLQGGRSPFEDGVDFADMNGGEID